MDVVLGVLGDVVVYHILDVVDVEPARSDVGRDENVCLAVFEVAQGFVALALRAVGMEHRHFVVVPDEPFADSVGVHSSAGENDEAVEFDGLQKFYEKVVFLNAVDGIYEVLDRVGGAVDDAGVEPLRVFERPFGKAHDRVGHRRREEQRLAVLRA